MAVEAVPTSDGIKLRNTKTKKLAGAVATKGKTASTPKKTGLSVSVADTIVAETSIIKLKVYGSRTTEIRAILKQMVETTPEQERQLTNAHRTFNMNPDIPNQFSQKHTEAFFARGRAKKRIYGKNPIPGYDAVIAQAKKLVWGDTRSQYRDEVWSDAKSVQRDTLVALLSYDLIGPRGFKREHFDSMLEPWESVFGKIKIKE
jgi:hypothetical protein